MKKDKFKTYILELSLMFILIFALFVPNIFTKINLAIFLSIFSIITVFLLKKKNILSIHNKEVTIMMLIFAIIYLVAFYLMGIYYGYSRLAITFNVKTLLKYIIPISVIIISSEIIRTIFLSQKKVKFGKFITTVSMVLIDIILYINIYKINSSDDLMISIGFITFASISCTLLYNYISYRYGVTGIILYRLITTLYCYIIPITPNVYILFRSILRMIYPYIIYLVIDYTFKKRNIAMEYMNRKKKIVSFGVTLVLIITIAALISCQFKYGILVIGSGSMSGTIDKGDAIIYESYKEQSIKPGDIIVFNKNDIVFVHRVIELKNNSIEGLKIYTKGDALSEADSGYITKNDLIGIVKLKIKYIGYPSLWLRSAFE